MVQKILSGFLCLSRILSVEYYGGNFPFKRGFLCAYLCFGISLSYLAGELLCTEGGWSASVLYSIFGMRNAFSDLHGIFGDTEDGKYR